MSTKQSLAGLFFLLLFMLFSGKAFCAYGTLGSIDIYVPSQILPGQPVQVNATVHTDVAGWGTCTVRDVRAVLLLPQGTTLMGNNETLIGNITGGGSADVGWTVVFSSNGTYDLGVMATGHDSNGFEAFSSKSVAVPVVPEFPTLLFLPFFITTTCVAVAVYRRSLHAPP